jgi:hypothetical protein
MKIQTINVLGVAALLALATQLHFATPAPQLEKNGSLMEQMVLWPWQASKSKHSHIAFSFSFHILFGDIIVHFVGLQDNTQCSFFCAGWSLILLALRKKFVGILHKVHSSGKILCRWIMSLALPLTALMERACCGRWKASS